jgi:quercetin dioxygenase-like cupin family protein
VTSGALVQAADVPAERSARGATVRNLLATGPAGPRLARRLVDVSPGACFDGTAGAGGELWFVIAGAGRLDVEGQPGLPVTGDRALWIPPAARYQLRANGPADLHLDAVTLPVAETGSGSGSGSGTGTGTGTGTAESTAPLVSDLRDCAVETTGDRRFRVLFGPGRGCAAATQFVGEIPPGRAPEHSHPYDELVLILAGEGVLHTGGGDHPIRAGSCAHLPPGLRHCLENTGPATLRVLGVFHPADSPAAKNGSD